MENTLNKTNYNNDKKLIMELFEQAPNKTYHPSSKFLRAFSDTDIELLYSSCELLVYSKWLEHDSNNYDKHSTDTFGYFQLCVAKHRDSLIKTLIHSRLESHN